MVEFPNGIQDEDDERSYQKCLADHQNGFVLNFQPTRKGHPASAHRRSCKTISYDPKEIGREKRSRKIVFESRAEMREWVETEADFEMGDINWDCPQC